MHSRSDIGAVSSRAVSAVRFRRRQRRDGACRSCTLIARRRLSARRFRYQKRRSRSVAKDSRRLNRRVICQKGGANQPPVPMPGEVPGFQSPPAARHGTPEIVRQKMKHWITAVAIGLGLAIAGPRVLEAIHPGSDSWGVLDAAVSASLWALLPSLAIGWVWQRVERKKGRYLPALVSAASTIILLFLVVQIVHHRWLWEVGMLVVVPLTVCGVPLFYLLLSGGKNWANQRPDGTPVKSPPSNPGQESGVPHP